MVFCGSRIAWIAPILSSARIAWFKCYDAHGLVPAFFGRLHSLSFAAQDWNARCSNSMLRSTSECDAATLVDSLVREMQPSRQEELLKKENISIDKFPEVLRSSIYSRDAQGRDSPVLSP